MRGFVCAAAIWATAALSGGCYTYYTGTARRALPEQIAADPSWTLVREVPFVAQKTRTDCGAAALAMVMSYFRVGATVDEVAAVAPPSEAGIGVGALRDLARSRGLEAVVTSSTLDDLAAHLERGHPVVVGLAKPIAGLRAAATAAHYEVVVGINHRKRLILCLDPARGLRQNTLDGFLDEWLPTRQVALVVHPADRG